MKTLLILLLALFLQLPGRAFTLSNQAQISILTCSPGAELYSLFGHTAIRIHDPLHQYDEVFNYGTFDFQTPNFYLKYAQGLLPYQLSTIPFRYFMYSYQMEQRSVYSQTLKLDSIQRQKLFDLLLENHQITNRYYLYNFLFDNCTTRARDILQKSLPNTITWNTPNHQKSFWNLLDEYLQASPWVHWGIHTILGQRGNQEATPFQYMFLPDYLMQALTTAQYEETEMASPRQTLYSAPTIPQQHPWYTSPTCIFISCTILLMSIIEYSKNKKWLNIITVFLFFSTGIIGLLIVFLGAFTAHPITAPNWNILWANPLNFIIWPFLFTKKMTKGVRYYLASYMFLLCIAVFVILFTHPAIPFSTIPLIILLLYISWKQYLKQGKIKK